MRKHTIIYAPVPGKTKDVETLNDPVFAQKLVGDGVAISPTHQIIMSPCKGKLNHLFSTNHAFTIVTDNHMEILVHLGIDTIELNGKGFRRIIDKTDCFVDIGEPLIEMDLDYIRANGKETDVIVIITDPESSLKFKKKINKKVDYMDEIFRVH